MAVSQEKHADLTEDGDSDWVRINSPGQVVQVDCIDSHGNSSNWNGVSASLLYSVDGKMRSIARDPQGKDISNKVAGFHFVTSVTGFVAVSATGINSEIVRIKVGQTSGSED